MALLNQNQYAKYKGVTRQAVSKAIKEGRVKVNRDGLIDTGETEQPKPSKAEAPVVPPYATSKAAAMAYDAKMKQLELQKLRGELVEAAEVAKLQAEAWRQVSNRILAIPDRCALACEGKTARQIRELLMGECTDALQAAADAIEEPKVAA